MTTPFLHEVQNALNQTVQEFQHVPYAFLYERDIQARLHAHLWAGLAPIEELGTPATFRKRFKGPEKFNSHPVRTEWPVQVGSGRLDVALISPDLWDPESLPWNQRASCAVELKLWSDPKGAQYVAGLEEDFFKLKAYFDDERPESCVGVAMLFVHPHEGEEKQVIKDLVDKGSVQPLPTAPPINLSAGVSGFIVTSLLGEWRGAIFQLANSE